MATRFIVEGASKETGVEQRLEIDADDADQAEQIASVRGMFVSLVRPVTAKSITLPVPALAAIVAALIVFMTGVIWWMNHSSRNAATVPKQGIAIQPTPAPAVVPAPGPAPVVAPSTSPLPAAVVQPTPVVGHQPAENLMTIAEVEAYGEHLAKLMKYDFDDVDRKDKAGGSVTSNSAKVIRTVLKKSDSILHPVVGEIVITTSHSAEDKSINYIYYDRETFTVTLYRDQAGWKCLKAARKCDEIGGFPKPTPNSGSEPGVEHDATTMIQYIMQIQIP